MAEAYEKPKYTALKGPVHNAHSHAPKANQKFQDLPKVYDGSMGNLITASADWAAYGVNGNGGVMAYFPHNISEEGSTRRLKKCQKVALHSGKINDLMFSPHNPKMLLTGSDDMSCRVTILPESLTVDSYMEKSDSGTLFPDADYTMSNPMKGHMKPVTMVEWHPCASGVFASAAKDKVVKIWDADSEASMIDYTGENLEAINSIKFNRDGTLLSMCLKESAGSKWILKDLRCEGDAMCLDSVLHAKKRSNGFFMDDTMIGAFTYNRQTKRIVTFFDTRMTSKAYNIFKLSAGGSVVMPHYDYDTKRLFMYAKGEGSFQFGSFGPKGFSIEASFKHNKAQKGGCWVAKKGLDVKDIEVMRLLKVTADNGVVAPWEVKAPLRVKDFNPSIFPDTLSYEASMTATDYKNGDDKPPNMMSMDPAASGPEIAKKMTYGELQAEVDRLKALCEANGIDTSVPEPEA
jgi:coronin-1B/1C/6